MIYLIAVARTGAFFLLMWAVSRRLGKHLIRRLTLFDFISAITLGSIAASTVTRDLPPGPSAVALLFWGGLAWFFDWLSLHGRGVHRFLDGAPVVLVENGKVLEANLRSERLTLSQLESMLRQQGYFEVSAVEIALLEPNGSLSVRPMSQSRPVQPGDLGIPTRYEALSTLLLQQGRPLTRELTALGLSEEWLRGELAKQGVREFDELFAVWLTSGGRLVVDWYNDTQH